MSAANPPANCCDDQPETGSLDVERARAAVLARLRPSSGYEILALESALGRVLAEDVISAIDVPPHRNSAMDGIAVRGDDLGGPLPLRFREVGAALAGHAYAGAIGPGECVRITTGAVVPDACDTVIMQELLSRDGADWTSEAAAQTGQNVRAAGEDIARGQVVVPRGKRLMPAELGLLASLGHGEVKVTRRLRAAVFSTGDEISTLGESLAPGTIYDSNRFTLLGMLTRLGIEVIDMGVVRDDAEAMHEALASAAEVADVIITSGGVSVGEADYIKPVLESLGQMRFCKVAIRPGRPFTYGHIGRSAFFGMPGNPVAVMVIFYAFLQPALRHLAGESELYPPRFQALARCRFRKRRGRSEYQRAVLQCDAAGRAEVDKTGAQGSGILSSMSQANCFVVLEPDRGDVEPGDSVTVEPFFALV